MSAPAWTMYVGRQHEVPMPDRIAALPRDGRGFPVPFVSEWTSERDGPPAEQGAVDLPGFHWRGLIPRSGDVYGEGRPMLGQVEMRRQLDCHLGPKCNVCGQVIGERLHFVGGWDEAVQSFTEAPLHRECARYALSVCPGLAVPRHDPEKRLAVCVVQRSNLLYMGSFIDGAYPITPEALAWVNKRNTMTGEDAAKRKQRGDRIGLISVVAFILDGRRYDSEDWLRGVR